MKYTNETFIKKATEKYGNKYTYDKVNYINGQTKVCIICPEHGEFYVRPADYLRGYGCPKCSNIKKIKNLSLLCFNDIFIIKYKLIKLNMRKEKPIRINESTLHKIIKESVKRVLRENNEINPPYEMWTKYLNGRTPIFEFEDGIVYVDYDENSGCLCSGHVTNYGFHKNGEVEVPVEDGDFQSALEEVYNQLLYNHEPI